MGTVERRIRAKEDLRRAILDAARELFATEDYNAVSMRKIAEKIEYSPTTIYQHFKDKEEILFHLLDEGFEMLFRRVSAPEGDDPVEALRAGLHAYLDFAMTQPHYYRLMFQLQDVTLSEEWLPHCQYAKESFGCIRRCVEAGMETGQFRIDTPEIIVSHIIWAAVHGIASLALSGHLKMMPPEAEETFFREGIHAALRGHFVAR